MHGELSQALSTRCRQSLATGCGGVAMDDFERCVRAIWVLERCQRWSTDQQLTQVIQRYYGSNAYLGASGDRGPAIGQYCISRDNNHTTRLFVAGVYDRRSGETFAGGYTNAVVRSFGPRENLEVARAADAIMSRLESFVRQDDVLEFYGHSAGGAVCEAVCLRWVQKYPGRNRIRIDTYGSPCGGTLGTWVSSTSIARNRWMNDGDPVPCVPWVNISSGQMFGLIVVGTPAERQNLASGLTISDFQQPQPGRRLSADRVRYASYPMLTGNIQEAIAKWIEGDEEAVAAHSLEAYSAAFASHSARTTAVDNASIGPARPQPRLAVDARVTMPFTMPWSNTQRVVMPFTIPPTGGTVDVAGLPVANVTVTRRPSVFLKTGKQILFKKVKVGPYWQVEYQGTIVLISDEKKIPTAFVKAANRMIRSIGDANTIYTGAFTSSLVALFQQAATDPAVCRPLMRVDP